MIPIGVSVFSPAFRAGDPAKRSNCGAAAVGFLNIGFLYDTEQEIDRNLSVISVTGSGAGIVKVGLGVKYIPYTKDRWSLYSDLAIGSLKAIAGGGSGRINTSNGYSSIRTITKTEKNKYLSFSLGANFRLARFMFLTSNIQYSISNFENNIGSVSGFTGYSINLGVGFSF